MKKVINVTERDIKYGIPKTTYACPVARAAKRVFHKDTEVEGTFMFVLPPGEKILLPLSVTAWILDYDAGYPVNPIKFEVVL